MCVSCTLSRVRARRRATQLLRCPRALHHHCCPPHPTLNSRCCVRPVVQIPNIKKLSELGAVNDKKNRFGQLPIAVLQTNMPDSHAPEILGSAIVPPQVKLKAAGIYGQKLESSWMQHLGKEKDVGASYHVPRQQ